MTESRNNFLRRFMRHRAAVAGIVLVLLVIAMAAAAALL